MSAEEARGNDGAVDGVASPEDDRPPERAESGVDRARKALARAKEDARRRGVGPGQRSARTGGGRGRAREGDRGGDPAPLGAAIGDLLANQGWEQRAAIGGVFGRWSELVGEELAEHTVPQSFTEGELVVTADSTAWATQLRLLATSLVHRLNAELGNGTVRHVKVVGPQARPGAHGRLRARGERGPRDTYG